VQLINLSRKLGIFICLSLSTVLFPQHSFAALLEVQQENNIVYFLFAAPNKIARYDLSSNKFINKISLDNVPSAFHVHKSVIYISYGTKLFKHKLDGFSATEIYQADSTILDIVAMGTSIYLLKENNRAEIISASNFLSTDNRYQYHYSKHTANIASPLNKAIYTLPTSNRPYKTLISDDGKFGSQTSSSFNRSDNPSAKIYLHPDESKFYTNTGLIYSTANLSFKGSVSGSVTDISFLDKSPVIIRGKKLYLLTEQDTDHTEITLDHTPSHVAAKGQIITTFVTTDSIVTAHQTNIDQLSKPLASTTEDPNSASYQAELITTDNNNIVYLVDKANPTIHRRKVAESEYASSWGLVNSPSHISYSESHQRLYLGYPSGKITYFDTSLAIGAVETHLISLTSEIIGLTVAGDYLYVNDYKGYNDTTSYSINKLGQILDTSSSSVSQNYVWNSLNDTIYRLEPGYLKWRALSSSTGEIDDNNYRKSLSSNTTDATPPLLISPNGQVLLVGSGKIIGAENKTLLNTLDNEIEDASWINDKLITVKEGGQTLQIWQEDYLLETEHPLSKTLKTRVFNLQDKLLIVKQSATRPEIIYSDLALLSEVDSDNDTISDLIDNCVLISNPDQSDLDTDGSGDLCDNDSDGDLIPNQIEITAGLNAFNKDDALLDLDGDGFNNLVEYFYSTDINNSESKAAAIQEMNETFDDAIPLGFYSSNPYNPLSIFKVSNSSYLALSKPNSDIQSQSLFYTADFEQGALSIKYGALFNNSSYSVTVIVDGKTIKSSSSYYYNNNDPMLISLEKGVHTIEFKATFNNNSGAQTTSLFFIDEIHYGPDSDGDTIIDDQDNCPTISNSYQHDSDNDGLGNECDNDPFDSDKDEDGYGDYLDNCPDTYNPDQLNIDNDNYGDACDDSDDSPSDVDQDGIPDSYDNCINTANPDQEDFDYDRIGDTCDIDIDNDGILNTLEDQFDFMSSYNSNDAYLDFDNDGASNQYEINNNSSPAQENTFAEIDLLDYYPVGDLDYFYISDYQFIRSSMKKTDTPGRFIISSSNGIELTIERRSSGIYLESFTSTSIYSDAAYTFENHLILPNSLKPGHTLTLNSTQTIAGSSDSVEYERSFYLKDVGERVWRGKVYPSITVIEDGAEKVYLKGIGQLTLNYMELDSVNFDFIEGPNVVAPKKSSGGGSLAPFVFFLLSIMAYATRTRRK